MNRLTSLRILVLAVILIAGGTAILAGFSNAPQAEDAPEPAKQPAMTAADSPAASPVTSPPNNMEIDVAAALKDRTLGDPNAPVKIIEYASMTCSHCANFHGATLPRLKKDYIETGKVYFTFRDFPFDDLGRLGAMMARCAPEDRYFQLVDVIFKDQERWIQSEDPVSALAGLGRLAGLKKEKFDACLQSEPLLLGLLERQREAQTKYGVRSTPSFILNDGADMIEGSQKYEAFQEKIDALLNK